MKNETNKYKLEKCKSILNKYNIGNVLYYYDYDFMIDIFSSHPEWEQKRGCGVFDISIIKDEYGHRCFCLHRTDGSKTDISYIKSIKSNTKLDDIKKACRDAIRSEVVRYRDNNVIYGISKCPITGETLNKENTQIDHYDITFIEMFNLWVKNKDIEFLHSKINLVEDNSFNTYFIDLIIVDDFIEFHNAHCKLRAVTRYANLSILKKL